MKKMAANGQNNRTNELLTRDALDAIRASACGEDFSLPGILILCPSFYGGGAERVACRLASFLAQKNRVVLLCLRNDRETYPLPDSVRLFVIPGFSGDWEEVDRLRAAFVRGAEEILQIRAAVSFLFSMNRINVLSGGPAKAICCERNDPALRDPLRMPQIGELYRKADCVVFQSAAVHDLFDETVWEHAVILPNPVEVSCLRTGGSHRIVNIGRLVPQKDQETLIRAFAAFYRTHPDYRLSLYGDGELEPALRGLASSLGVGDAVSFEGTVSDIHVAIADAEIFVLSSRFEGLPNALLECMMMGFPCISARFRGADEVIRDGENGLLTEPGEWKQLTEALTRLTDDPELRERLGKNAMETAEAYCSERVLKQWADMIMPCSFQGSTLILSENG